LPEDGSLSLTGTFDDFSVNTIEDEIIPGATYGSISVMCDDCVIQGEVYKEYHPALQIILQDDSENVFKFVKIEKALPTGEE
jgi:hypothetical protein